MNEFSVCFSKRNLLAATLNNRGSTENEALTFNCVGAFFNSSTQIPSKTPVNQPQ